MCVSDDEDEDLDVDLPSGLEDEEEQTPSRKTTLSTPASASQDLTGKENNF